MFPRTPETSLNRWLVPLPIPRVPLVPPLGPRHLGALFSPMLALTLSPLLCGVQLPARMAPSRALSTSSLAFLRSGLPIAAAEAARSTTRLARRRAFAAAFFFRNRRRRDSKQPCRAAAIAGETCDAMCWVILESGFVIRQRGRHTSISGSSRLGTALCTSVLANPAFALLSRIRLKAPAPSTTKVLSLEMKSELKTLV